MSAASPSPAMSPEHLASLSHELRTPLNGVLGMTKLLEMTALTPEQRAYVGALMESGQHLLDLVNDVLDYARLGAGPAPLDNVRLGVEDLVRSVAELMAPRAHEKGLEIGWAVDPAAARLTADGRRLRQILLNLVGNAIKFTPAGGVLVLAQPGANGAARFCITDTGPGVPPSARERIFDAFTQLDDSAAATGAGLGLAIVRRLAEAMGARVWVEGAPSGGAAFIVEGPFGGLAGAAGERPLAGIEVAIATPNPVIAEAAALCVRFSGGRVRVARAPEDLGRGGGGEVRLIDHAGAGEDGRLAAPTGAAIVLLRPEERGLIAPYRAAGFDGYLLKPLRRRSIVERVLAALGEGPAADTGEDERLRRADAPPSAPSPATGARILLAEDNPVNVTLVTAILTREGCEIDTVADGEAAVAAASARAYDLVLMDMRMPKLDGLAATRALRARGVTTPVLALTANAFDDDRQAALAAGMDDFLVKPLGPEGLRAAVSLWTGPGAAAEGRRPRASS
ncbi:MAG TPA: response regulator [Caulobacteraceae bacterium]|nr:response regulator [Caulobacteraceae bacterium]